MFALEPQVPLRRSVAPTGDTVVAEAGPQAVSRPGSPLPVLPTLGYAFGVDHLVLHPPGCPLCFPGPPCTGTVVLPVSWETRLREDLKLPIARLDPATVPLVEPRSMFVSYTSVPLNRRAGIWPDSKPVCLRLIRLLSSTLWRRLPRPDIRTFSSRPSGTGTWVHEIAHRMPALHVFNSGLRTLLLEAYGFGDTYETLLLEADLLCCGVQYM